MKRLLCALIAMTMALSFLSLGAFAYNVTGGVTFDSGIVYDEDDDVVSRSFSIINNASKSSTVEGDGIYFGKTYYFQLAEGTVPLLDLTDDDMFSFKLSRDKNCNYLDSVKLVTKNIAGARRNYIAIKIKSASKTEEQRMSFNVYFSARKSGTTWNSGDVFDARFNLWVNNSYEEGDADIEAGDGVVFKPVSNDLNMITWGANEEIASLEFSASSEAKKFYAMLSTKTSSAIYSRYGDPVNAELFFRTFNGVTIDSTSRATLTLYNPWNDVYDYDYNYNYNGFVDPRNVYIYVDRGGYLENITDQFVYVNGDNTPSGIDGWQTRTRALGAYVISDIELPLDNYVGDGGDDGIVVVPPENLPSMPVEKPPATGSYDFVAMALALSAVSAGAVLVCKKRKKK